MSDSAIVEIHKKLGAEVVEVDGTSIPAKYLSQDEEFAIARKAAALFDISHFGRLFISGKDSLDLLNRISTNELNGLRPGMGKQAFLATEKGRVVDLCTVFAREDGVLVLTSPGNSEKVRKWIEKFIVSEDVKLQDAANDLVLFLLAGPESATFLRNVAHSSYKTFLDVGKMRRYDFIRIFLKSGDIFLSKTNLVMMNGYLIMVKQEAAGDTWQELVGEMKKIGGSPAGLQTFDVLRVENGTPLSPTELNEEVNPLTVDILDAVHNNKGCYVGQEVIARLQTYDKVRRRLVGLISASKLPQGAKVFDAKSGVAGSEIGVITSSVKSPGLEKEIALGYLAVKEFVPGSKCVVRVGNRNIDAVLSSLPFFV